MPLPAEIICPECGTPDWHVVTLEKTSITEVMFVDGGAWIRAEDDEEVIETTAEEIHCVNDHLAGPLFHELLRIWTEEAVFRAD